MARNYVCDVPGCTRCRERWKRICDSCWPQLPAHIRHAITENHRIATRASAGSTAASEARKVHREACKAARDHLAHRAAPQAHHHISPEQAFANTARLLGEH